MCEVWTAAPLFGNQSSWMHRCIGPGGSASFLSVWNHCLPSTKAVMWSGAHSTAQLCHSVASILTSPWSWELLRP